MRRWHLSYIGGSRGGTVEPDPSPEQSQKYRVFFCNTGPDPLKNRKLPSQNSMFGHHRPVSETPLAFRWRADYGPFIAIFGSSIPSPTKKTLSNLDPL